MLLTAFRQRQHGFGRHFPRCIRFTSSNNFVDEYNAHNLVDDDDNEEPLVVTSTPKHSRRRYKFVDKVRVEVKGGKGGNGCVSYDVLAPGKKRPSGGSGGKGGNVYIVADRNLTSLKFETFYFNAQDGGNGGSSNCTGRNGKDVYLKVPLGTLVSQRFDNYHSYMQQYSTNDVSYADEDDDIEGVEDVEIESVDDEEDIGEEDIDDEYDDEVDIDDDEMFKNQPKGNVIDLDTHNATVLVAEGGKPGIGNKILGGSKERKIHSSPRTYMAGSMGEQKSLLLELKLIADVGLVGFPNAGKSTLLKALSNANPTIAAYPFTTLHPNIGVIQYSDLERVTMADIPGLIDGAHDNRGLGHDFLRHIERTKILLYVIDGAGSEGRSPIHDFLSLRNELQLYDPTLLDKPSIVFSNKHDLKKAVSKKLQKEAAELGLELYHGTAQKGVGMAELANKLREILENTKLKEKEKDQ